MPKVWKGGGWRQKAKKLIDMIIGEDWDAAIDYAWKLRMELEGDVSSSCDNATEGGLEGDAAASGVSTAASSGAGGAVR